MISRTELEKIIPGVSRSYDVIVAGGGPAGIGAALGAAMQGANTLLLEARSFFGGVAAIAMWMPMNRLLLNGGLRGGAHDLLVEKIQSYGEDAYREGRSDMINGDGMNVHPEYLRLACLELLEEQHCHYRLYSPVTGITMSGNRLTGVQVTTKAGIQKFTANVVVDATGDGDVAYFAGAEMVVGREEDGRSMPVSLVFALANVDVNRLMQFLETDRDRYNQILEEAKAGGCAVAAWYSFDTTTIPGVVNVNNGALHDLGNINGTKADELTIAERSGIQVAHDFVKFAREKQIPGLENCHLMRVGAHVGVRDTRRLVGEYVLTLDDALHAPDFPDIVARKYGAIDANQLFIGPMHSGFGYPYRSLLPKRIDNLLVAGRCASASFLGHAAGKSMGNMIELGQAAGVAAAMCAVANIPPRSLDVSQLQQVLMDMGVHL
ncbi:MAG: FAD-dependent oxidoreductase [Anaerolineae bacterium]|nr:FAD-dependent oxidoreductase [Anaerolineae bacterium]